MNDDPEDPMVGTEDVEGLLGAERDPGYALRLTARLAAEPHVLLGWAKDTQHPLLHAAYLGLAEQVKPRAAALAQALVEAHPGLRSQAASVMETETTRAMETRFEPSRLKWLLAGRRDRLAHDRLPGYSEHREAENEETDQLEQLLQKVLRTVC